METQQAFIEAIMIEFEKRITDKVFLMIENDRELFHRWLDLLAETPRDVINSSIAQAIGKRFDLESTNINDNPKSFLIKSFHEFKRRKK